MAKLPRDTITHYEHDGKGNINITITDLIRCKDCKHHHKDRDGCVYCDRIDYGYGWRDDDYCSRAERRTDD